MAFFELNSDITIGNFRFSGVHEVRVTRSMHSLADAAWITIPSIAVIRNNGEAAPVTVTTASKFAEGNPVVINLGYNGVLNEEFRGFVKRIGTGMPLVVECEGYVRELRLNVNYSSGSAAHTVSTTAKELLLNAVAGTDISVLCPVDFKLQNFYVQNADGLKICDYVKQCSDHVLNLFFLEPTVLFCGLVYTPCAEGTNPFSLPTVNYRLGWNVIKDNGLKERIPVEKVQFFYNGKLASGLAIHTHSKDVGTKNKMTKLQNNVPDVTTLQGFAQEKAYMANYSGYEGRINAFLNPYALPGYRANIVDARYPQRNGVYLIESTDVTFGLRGARRSVEIGPKIGFDA